MTEQVYIQFDFLKLDPLPTSTYIGKSPHMQFSLLKQKKIPTLIKFFFRTKKQKVTLKV